MSFEDVARRMKGHSPALATPSAPLRSRSSFQFGAAMLAAEKRSRTTTRIVLGLLALAAGAAIGGFTYLS